MLSDTYSRYESGAAYITQYWVEDEDRSAPERPRSHISDQIEHYKHLAQVTIEIVSQRGFEAARWGGAGDHTWSGRKLQ